jgi:hypothetical protein
MTRMTGRLYPIILHHRHANANALIVDEIRIIIIDLLGVLEHRGRFSVLTKTEKNDRIIRVMHYASCSKDKEQQWYIPHNHERDQSTESI